MDHNSKRTWRQVAVAGLAAVLGACGLWPASKEPAAPSSVPSTPARPDASPAAPAAAAVGPSRARTLEAYKLEVAQHIASATKDLQYTGAPPNPLKSIVVVKLLIDRDGRAQAMIERSNKIAATERVALDSVRRVAAFPKPSGHLLDRRGRVELIETWLFDAQDRFQLRSFAQEQASE